ncbi:UbiE/COQ5 methyltransferase [Chthoniobacter flavus Ellin428]|uniref:UbiE/COQ5 methyltransferase n=1 Tax=Chthoniobacter flavus Ellin428 TaxID=497964 RepID=B4DAK0_9BACT|nr:methyltransferase domain-containing protein [Chthoniobacter flavus]EDY16518.1 UbiE/COQ5 methyltransferase [Chthoniobacter flavus Ellin428]TCO85223.1 methyltransferase family protein [Chthoniobacter flavus]
MKRAFDPQELELMDRPQPVTPELEECLRNLVSLNRFFGSHRLIRKFLAQWLVSDRTYRVLDLCTGAGDIPRLIVDWARQAGVTLRVDAVDASDSTLEIARRGAEAYPEIQFVKGDALKWESRETYDLVTCSLALHHFSDKDAVMLLRRCRALSNRFVLVSDLERTSWGAAGIRLLTALVYRQPMTRADANTSIHRAFSFPEMRALAEAAGWESFGHMRFLFCRQAIWLDERTVGEIPAVSAVPEVLPCPT